MVRYLVGAPNARTDEATGAVVPAGVVHAVNSETRHAACGVNANLLTVFETLEFDTSKRVVHCPDCRRALES